METSVVVAVKVCGVRSVADARGCVDAGVDAIGINFWPGSARYCEESVARSIVDAVPASVLVVGVFVNATLDQIERARRFTGIGCVQLHGDEPPDLLDALLPHAYKALRAKDHSVLDEAARFGGKYVMLDAYVPGTRGGTGAVVDWELAAELAERRHLVLAGGLNPANVGEAVKRVSPFCVDVASGVEHTPGEKDLDRVRTFVAAAKEAA